MQNISFAFTTQQIRDRSKTVTRRLGWRNVRPGQLLQGVVKGMGLPKGTSPEKLAIIIVVDARREPLGKIDADDVRKEGFPDLTPDEFCEMFSRGHNNCKKRDIVTRIEFRFIPGGRN